MTVTNTEIGAFLHALTEDTTPDAANDEVMTYDASASAVKRVKLDKLSGASLSITDGSTTVTGLTDLTVAATGDATVAVTDDTGGAATLTIGATGGTGGSSLPIDAAAEAAVGSGDLFAGTTLDGGWTSLQSTAVTTVDRSQAGWCVLENAGDTSGTDRGLKRAFSPAGDFSVYAKIGAITLGMNYMWAGIFVGAADPSDGASGHRLGLAIIFNNDPQFISTKADAGSRTDWLGKPLGDSTMGAGAQKYITLPVWLRIRRAGSTVYVGVSYDGVKFYENSTTTTIAFTVATCGILIAESSATYPIRASFDYIATTG